MNLCKIDNMFLSFQNFFGDGNISHHTGMLLFWIGVMKGLRGSNFSNSADMQDIEQQQVMFKKNYAGLGH